MLAVRLHAPGEPLRVEEVPLPEPRGSQVRVRVAGCGVCRTDLHVVDGVQRRITLPRTLGHEIGGWVDAAGPDARPELSTAGLREGDAVVVYGGWGCGRCGQCRGGATQRCPDSVAPGFQADGGYAEAMLVPNADALEPLGALDPAHAAPLADAGMTALRAVTRLDRWLTAGARVAVIGAGGVGQFAIQALRLGSNGANLRIVVADPEPRRRERARALGADATMPGAAPDAVLAALDGPADAVLDLVGSDATLEQAIGVVAPGGAVAVVGEAGGSVRLGIEEAPLESWLTTVAWGSRDDLRSLVRLATEGRLEWATERVPLREASRAHERVRSGLPDGRVVLVP
jgi:alcohol dehydrogenase, propanol-preferring